MRTKSALIFLALAILFSYALCQDYTADYWLKESKELLKKGDELSLQGLFDEAEKPYNESILYCNKALDLDPYNVDALIVKAWALNSIEKYDVALEFAEKVLKDNPNNANAWNNKGWALEGQGSYLDAIECYNKAIDLDPNFADPWNSKGNCYAYLRKSDEALECWDRAIALAPNFTHPWVGKATLYLELGEKAKADAAMAKARDLGWVGDECE